MSVLVDLSPTQVLGVERREGGGGKKREWEGEDVRVRSEVFQLTMSFL